MQKAVQKLRLDDACLKAYPEHSRQAVQSWIMQGKVAVNGTVLSKVGASVPQTAKISINARVARFVCRLRMLLRLAPACSTPAHLETLKMAYADRGGEKLEAALLQFNIDVVGKSALDCGISTGGFTDCLLQHGARHVVGVDVGYGQVLPEAC